MSGHIRPERSRGEKMERCYLCEKEFELTKEVFQTGLLYGKISIKRDIQWKDLVLTMFAKNSEDEDVLLCRRCLVSALSLCSREVNKTNIPITAGIQFKGF